MLEVQLAPPSLNSFILGDAQMARIDRWAASQREELARMEATLTRLRAELAAMERLQSDAGDAAAPPPPALLAIIDRMLEAASGRLEDQARAAHAGASQQVTAAIRDAAALLQGAGLEPVASLRRIAPAVPGAPQPRRPRRASALRADWAPSQTPGAPSPGGTEAKDEFDIAFEKFWWSDESNRPSLPASNRDERP